MRNILPLLSAALKKTGPILGVLMLSNWCAPAQAGTIIASDSRVDYGGQTNGDSSTNGFSSNVTSSSSSADGTKIAFVSRANNLVVGDTNNADDIFVRDLTAGTTVRVSIASDGTQANNISSNPSISADGTKVVFTSQGSNLVSGDSNGTSDVFLRDLTTGTTTRVSIASDGSEANGSSLYPCISGNGTKVAFASGATNLISGNTTSGFNIFVKDLNTGAVTLASPTLPSTQLTNGCLNPSLNYDGTKVAFETGSTNLVANDTNNQTDIFVRDLTAGTTARASVDSNGNQADGGSSGASLSADGTKVAFYTGADNLFPGDSNSNYDVVVKNLATGAVTLASVNSSGIQADTYAITPSLSADGTKVAFHTPARNMVSGETEFTYQVYVRDLTAGTTTRVSVDSNGNKGNNTSTLPCLSADGTHVAFTSKATNLIPGDTNGFDDVFVRDLTANTIVKASTLGVPSGTIFVAPGNGTAQSTTLSQSADGTKVVFVSYASNLVANDTNSMPDIFVRDFTKGINIRVNVASDGTQASFVSSNPCISGDGTKVAFVSGATNLVSGDTNGYNDVFVKDLTTGTLTRVSVASDGTQANNQSDNPCLSADGNKVVFESSASNLVSGDTNGASDVFVRDLTTGVTTRVNVDNNGNQVSGSASAPKISSDGTKVVFQSMDSTLVSGDTNFTQDIFLRDLSVGTTTRVTTDSSGNQGNSTSSNPSISADGSTVAFASYSTNLVSGDTNNTADIFVKNLNTGVVTRASIANDGTQTNNYSDTPSLNGDGTKVAFVSIATNLVGGDSNGQQDIFVRDLTAGVTSRANVDNNGNEANQTSAAPSLNFDGSKVAYNSFASNLVSGDTNGQYDVFVSNIAPTTISIDDVSLAEGDSGTTNFTFTVKLNAASLAPVTATWDTTDNTADGNDYDNTHDSDNGTPGSITIPAGSTQTTITVAVKGDRVVEADETFSVDLSFPSGASISDGHGVGTILNDDHAPGNIGLSRQAIPQHSGTNALVGVLSATDPDVGDSITFSLPVGVDENSAFQIVDGKLRSAQDFDVATQSSYTVTVRATDLGGNTTDKQFSITILETEKPTVAITSPTANQKLLVPAFVAGALNGTATDNVGVIQVRVRLSRKVGGINYYWNGTDFVTTQATVLADLTGTTNATWVLSTNMPPAGKLVSGPYAVQASAYDAAGNKSDYADCSFTLSQDLSAPTVAVSSPAANAKVLLSDFLAGSANGTAGDDTGVTAVKLRLSRKVGSINYYWNGTDFVTSSSYVDADLTGTTNATWQFLTNLPPANKLTVGAYSLAAYSLDAAGNKSAISTVNFSLNADFVAPSVSITTPASNAIVNINNLGTGAITGVAGDDNGVVSVKLKLQRKRGTVTEYWNGSTFTTTATLFDATVTTVGGTSVTWSYDTPIPAALLDRGSYTVYATAYDAAGNYKTSSSRVFTLNGVVASAAAPAPVSAPASRSAGNS